tara:strand:- start:957 stop:1574 length:618 start_codon:yes stop_codon:yes gene_type:complete
MAVISNGTTLIDAGALGASAGAGKMTLIKTLTASSSATLTFHNGASSVVLDSTYDSYLFLLINMHPSNDNSRFSFQVNAAGASGFNETISCVSFDAYQNESGSGAGVEFSAGLSQAQGTAFQEFSAGIGNNNDDSTCGYLQLFNPSSTTFVKHFIGNTDTSYTSGLQVNWKNAGYINTTNAIDEIQFKMESGYIDSGIIKMYGIG